MRTILTALLLSAAGLLLPSQAEANYQPYRVGVGVAVAPVYSPYSYYNGYYNNYYGVSPTIYGTYRPTISGYGYYQSTSYYAPTLYPVVTPYYAAPVYPVYPTVTPYYAPGVVLPGASYYQYYYYRR